MYLDLTSYTKVVYPITTSQFDWMVKIVPVYIPILTKVRMYPRSKFPNQYCKVLTTLFPLRFTYVEL